MSHLKINFEISKVVGFKRHYTDSLDAMHEAEKALLLDQQDTYASLLGAEALKQNQSEMTYRSAWKGLRLAGRSRHRRPTRRGVSANAESLD